MTTLPVEIPGLPKLDKEDVKAIRGFLPGKILGRTAALLSLLLLVLGFVAAVRLGLHQFPELERILPPWAFGALLALCFLAVAAQMILEWRTNRSRAALQQLAVKPGAAQTGYFRIGAYADTAEDRAKFSRPDQAEKKVLEWLKQATQVPLYLTGDSGSGKSSLLNAYVLPALREQGWTVIEARVWQDPLDALGKALSKVQNTKRTKADSDRTLRGLVEGAAHKSKQTLVVLDQFEEFIILGTSEIRQAFAAFVADLQLRPVGNFVLLLALRSDYQSLLEDASLPPLRSGENLFQLARFQLSAAEAFMKQSGLGLQPAALDHLLTSAAGLDDTPGLVRPITINVIGFVLASGRAVASSLDAGTLVRQYIERTLQQPAIRDYAPRLLEQLITEQGTKWPRSEQSLATDAALRPAEVRAVLNCLSDAGLARPLDAVRGEWELSHDFIARAVGRFLGRHRTRVLRRVGAYAAPVLLILALLGGAGAVVLSRFSPDTIRVQLSDIGIVTRSNEAGEMIVTAASLDDEGLSRAAPLLAKFGGRLSSLDLSGTQVANVDALKGLTALQYLYLSGTQVANIAALKGLTALQGLYLSGTQVANVEALKGLTALQSLDLSGTRVANVEVLKGLTALHHLYLSGTRVANVEALKGLTALQSLDLSGTQVVDVAALQGMTALQSLGLSVTQVANVEALTGLTALQTLGLLGTQVANVHALRRLTALQSLDLSGTKVVDVEALNGLTALQNLHLSGTQVADVEALKGLIALQTLGLSGTQVANVEALKGLTALQYLYLSGTRVANIDALKGLTALQYLYLSGTQVAHVDALKGLTALQGLDLSRTRVKDVDALKGLTTLQYLYLSGTRIANVDALKRLTALQSLDLSGTQVADVDALKGLNALQSLGLSGTRVANVDALNGLNALQSLDLSGTQVANVDALQGLGRLLTLNLSETQVTNVEALKGLTALGIVRGGVSNQDE